MLCCVELKKDPGIPNLFPFKEQLLQQMQARKERAEGEKERQRLQRQREHAKKRRSLQAMQNDVQKRTKEFEKKVTGYMKHSPPPHSRKSGKGVTSVFLFEKRVVSTRKALTTVFTGIQKSWSFQVHCLCIPFPLPSLYQTLRHPLNQEHYSRTLLLK